jgi:hypothetical protein
MTEKQIVREMIRHYVKRRDVALKNYNAAKVELDGARSYQKHLYREAIKVGYSYNSIRRMIAEAKQWS